MQALRYIYVISIFILLNGCYAMMTTHWAEPGKDDPQAKIIAEEEIDLIKVNGLPVNDWKYFTFEKFVLPAGKSQVVVRVRKGNEHFGLGFFDLDLEDGATYFLKKEEIGANYRIFFLNSDMVVVFEVITPKRFFEQRFTLPLSAIPKG